MLRTGRGWLPSGYMSRIEKRNGRQPHQTAISSTEIVLTAWIGLLVAFEILQGLIDRTANVKTAPRDRVIPLVSPAQITPQLINRLMTFAGEQTFRQA